MRLRMGVGEETDTRMDKKGFQIACQNTGKKKTILPIFSQFQVK